MLHTFLVGVSFGFLMVTGFALVSVSFWYMFQNLYQASKMVEQNMADQYMGLIWVGLAGVGLGAIIIVLDFFLFSVQWA